MKIALTYDDGPNTPYTLDLLEVLAKHGVLATFFVVGKYVLQHPEIVQATAKAGHLIGNHTFSHPQLPSIPLPEVETQISRCSEIITEAIGPHSNLFRPPFVLTNPAIEKIVASQGLTTVMWKAAGSDWRIDSHVYFITEKVHAELAGGGGIILLHDGGHDAMGAPRRDTIKATDIMIARYKNEGYEFVSPLEI